MVDPRLFDYDCALSTLADSNGGDLEQRRIIQSLLFTGPIEYSADDGFGTTKFSMPFKLLQLDRHEKPNLVEAAGIEPASESTLPLVLHA